MQCCKLTKVMLNEFLKNRKGTFCLRSKKVLYGFILQEKVSKRVRDTNDREESGRERGHGGYCNFACCRLKIQILLSLHALNID